MTKHIILTDTVLDPADVILVVRGALPQAITGLVADTYTVRDTSAPVSGVVTPAVTGGTTASDNFTGEPGGTALSAVTADLGSWTIPVSSSGVPKIRPSGDILIGPTSADGASTGTFHLGQIDAQPVSAGVFVEIDLHVLGSFTAAQLAAYAATGIGTGTSRTMYIGGYNGSNLRILKIVNNSASVLAQVSATLAVGTDYTLRFECETGAQRLYLDGALMVATTEPDLSGMGDGLGLAMQVGTTRFTDTSGPGVRAIRVGTL